jgi:pimeloyl-ACP methyl ester carboxylesterase
MGAVQEGVKIAAGKVRIDADVTVPDEPVGAVVFAHGSGSSRHSTRNQYVASRMQEAGLATVLADLLTPEEERVDSGTGELRFDIALLASRVVSVVDWTVSHGPIAGLPIGLFGASTGAAAALVAAAVRPVLVGAVVSRGGRPDLAGGALREVRQPTLLIVGGNDGVVVDLNRQAFAELPGEKELVIIPGATHLFEEPGALEEVARLATAWFTRHLPKAQ